MIPGISGGLTNSGSMPISANGGAAGDATATNNGKFGGIKQGSINMGGGAMAQLPMLVLACVLLFVMVKKK